MPDKRNKYLIIQTAFLGDTALSLCMARYIKSRDKMAEVFFMTTPASAVTAELCPDIDEVLIYDKRSKNSGLLGLFRTIRMVRSFSFDAVFCPHRSFRSAILSYFSGSPFRYGYHKNSLSFLFNRRVRYIQQEHEILRLLRLVRKHFDDSSEEMLLPRLNVSAEKTGSICIAPGSVWKTKIWPENKWAELLLLPPFRDRKVLIIGSDSDKKAAERIISLSGRKDLINRCGLDSLKDSFFNISSAALLVSNDSAPQHFAAALGTPCITVFGATVPEFGFGPAGENSAVIQTDLPLDCRPCGIHGLRECRIGTFDCMMSVSPETVAEKAEEILGNSVNDISLP